MGGGFGGEDVALAQALAVAGSDASEDSVRRANKRATISLSVVTWQCCHGGGQYRSLRTCALL